MNFKIRISFLFLFIFLSSSSFAQYKYDIGLKMSSYELERFQIDARFHLKSPYTLLFAFSDGSRNEGFYSQTIFYGDSLASVASSNFNARNNVFKFGVQRKLSFLATDVFYAGATIGFGFERQRYYQNTLIFDTSNPDSTGMSGTFNGWEPLEVQAYEGASRLINAQLGVSFGMDVPLSKRFSINAEIGIAGGIRQSLNFPITTIDIIGSISGGVRYSFGKIE